MMLLMVDMGMGNLGSALQAFQRIGAQVAVSDRPEEIARADALILPGVGAFGDGMACLRSKGLVEPIRRHALENRKPILGICIGMQLLADEGEEHGLHQGLGLVPGRVVRLSPMEPGTRVPNIGWHSVRPRRPGVLLGESRQGADFYFVHSYQLLAADQADIAASFPYGGQDVAAVIERSNIFGVQFHPEKSQDAGLSLLSRFVRFLQGERTRGA